LKVSVAKGHVQEGVISPLLWSFIVDNPLWETNNDGHYTVGYVDDTAVLINGKFSQTVPEVL
jgi:hypothetical protein